MMSLTVVTGVCGFFLVQTPVVVESSVKLDLKHERVDLAAGDERMGE